MDFSADGLALLKSFESCRLTAYKDGGGRWTIGWGDASDVHEGLTITQAEADERLEVDLVEFCGGVRKALGRVVLTDNQFSALVCFAYNVGLQAFRSSTLLRCVLKGNTKDAAAEFGKWNHDNGRVVDGLTRRRAAERALFEFDVHKSGAV